MTDGAPTAPRRALIAWAIGLVRYVAAWAVACVVTVLALYAAATLLDLAAGGDRAAAVSVPPPGELVRRLLPFLVDIAVTSGPAWPLVVFLMRVIRAPRGWGDVVFAALLAAVARVVLVDPDTPASVLAVFGLAGGLGGLAFWLVTGVPRRPYRNLVLPGRLKAAPAV